MILAALPTLLAQLNRDETLEAMRSGLRGENTAEVRSLLIVGAGAILAILLAAWIAWRQRPRKRGPRDFLTDAAWQVGLTRSQLDDLRTLARRANLAQPTAALLSPANLAYAIEQATLTEPDPTLNARLDKIAIQLFGVSLPEEVLLYAVQAAKAPRPRRR